MSYFGSVFGFEESIQKVYSNIDISKDSTGNILMHNKILNETYSAGKFEVVGINDIPKHEDRNNGTLNIIVGGRTNPDELSPVDSLASQSIPENDGATFLAASNFNCLEFTSEYQSARDGISSYEYDPTQGPYCAIACAPGALYRNYFVEINGKRGQFEHVINLLHETPLRVQGGYPSIDQKEERSLNESGFDWNNLNHYKIGSHSNLTVTTSRLNGRIMKTDMKQIAHHVYAAAFNFNGNVVETPFTTEISEYLLEAEYKATILQAWDNSIKYAGRKGSNKLYLTLLGGGVFGNPMDLICDSITNNIDLIKRSGLEVYVVCFSHSIYNKVYPFLAESVKETNGKVVGL
ncbi:hypothetical protein TVAG_489440 [Trichomonas vaginalis G3]|uniref:Uncharacterized protein n=1 Tax=Trichomonas vaginalis (strain ATCC PRA-98 / G3) TaxID=412133 RepID=A2FEI0_TRIV3|nr:hypothetical protein TVAGG3_0878360 [Trichomonas vaginalis G3]EAX96662.1 hypothetical protein TVAG_489440 [Trichomonas vaginalis G3]KAI5501859.1 hypothetical protein TVAGG3_0878360 [Trichomonas vaginalis G3]|eukprot:XP_001309592.1 hypothetical protein [Trichomonas vaginalis G3]